MAPSGLYARHKSKIVDSGDIIQYTTVDHGHLENRKKGDVSYVQF